MLNQLYTNLKYPPQPLINYKVKITKKGPQHFRCEPTPY